MKVGAKKEHQKFLQVVQPTVRDKNISLTARGLLTFMLSYPNDWDFSLNFLVEHTGSKIATIRTALKELEEHGYLQKVRVTNSKGHIVKWDYIVYETNNPNDWII